MHRAYGMMLLVILLALSSLPGRSVAGPLLLFDVSNSKVLYAEDVDRLWYPASLTKIMTAYVAFDAIKKGQLTFK